MRTQNSMRNIVVAIIGQLFGIILQFISRKIFIVTMGTELLGVNSIFANILSILSLAEMGVGSAIAFSLYKPLADGNEEKINSIMLFYRNVYRIIALIVSLCGIIVVPFFPLILKVNIQHIYLYYFLYLSSTVISYLCAYKRTLIIADQKSYIASIYRYSYIIILNIVQIFILIYTHDYALFLIAQIILSFIENILISKCADYIYPYLKIAGNSLERQEKRKIFKSIKALLLHKIGSVVVTNTDTILLSAIVNIQAVAIYANYKLIFSGLNTILSQLYSALTASVGNLMVQNDKEYSFKIYKVTIMFSYWIYGIIGICLYILLNDLIKLWLVHSFTESKIYELIIILNFFIIGVREPTNMFKNSIGLFWDDRYKAIIESILNIFLSILLGFYFGANGIFAATLISCILVPFWFEPWVLYKKYWNIKLKEYFFYIRKYFFIILIIGLLQEFITSYFIVTSWTTLILKSFFVFITSNIMMIILICKSQEYIFCYKKIMSSLSLFKKRG